MTEINCEMCGAPFMSARTGTNGGERARFCSPPCVNRHLATVRRKFQPKTCAREGCDVVFTPRAAAARFCSQECYGLDKRTLPDDRRAPRQCAREGCDVVFTPRSGNPGKYCSVKCRSLDRRLGSSEDYGEQICAREGCDNAFRGGFVGRLGQPKLFCSRECYGLDKSAKHAQRPERTRVCERCGETFTMPPGRSKQRFCSNECRFSSQRKWNECQHPEGCTVPNPDRIIGGYCATHYNRLRLTGELGPPGLTKLPAGSPRITHDGYRLITGIDVLGDKVRMREHRFVMEHHLGRKLRKGEEVHHRDRDKLNNRLSNLELWQTSQPAGGRAEDIEAARRERARESALRKEIRQIVASHDPLF